MRTYRFFLDSLSITLAYDFVINDAASGKSSLPVIWKTLGNRSAQL
jgi:hypothetical protein